MNYIQSQKETKNGKILYILILRNYLKCANMERPGGASFARGRLQGSHSMDWLLWDNGGEFYYFILSAVHVANASVTAISLPI